MPGLGTSKLQKNPLPVMPTGVIFISPEVVNIILPKRVKSVRRGGSNTRAPSILRENREFSIGFCIVLEICGLIILGIPADKNPCAEEVLRPARRITLTLPNEHSDTAERQLWLVRSCRSGGPRGKSRHRTRFSAHAAMPHAIRPDALEGITYYVKIFLGF